eukprot:m.9899 g.9899  ORF g.9899 m.9899 type:complete len:365 (+) comp21729_c0_seq2:101-1195(+)
MSTQGEEIGEGTMTADDRDKKRLQKKRPPPDRAETGNDRSDPKRRSDEAETRIAPPRLMASTSIVTALPKDECFNVKTRIIDGGFGSRDETVQILQAKEKEKSSFSVAPPLTSSSTMPLFSSSAGLFGKSKKPGNSENLFLHFVKGVKSSEPSQNDGSSHSQDTNEQPSSSGFVFGRNLSDRAVVSCQLPAECEPKEDSSSSQLKDNQGSTTSLHQDVKLSPKVVTEQAEARTGEENEKNVLQVSCILYIFEAESHSWKVKGRGLLRLNDQDTDTSQSRIVMRTQGNLRVILNTLLWPEMVCEKVSRKSVRLTALDPEGGMRVYLATCAVKDCDVLYAAVDQRLQVIKSQGSNSRKSVEEFGSF